MQHLRLSLILSLIVIISIIFPTAEAKADDFQMMPAPGIHTMPMDVGILSINGLVETTYDDPQWALVTSDLILRENLCDAAWYDRVFNPCYPNVTHYWKLGQSVNAGKAFPMGAMGPVTFDGLRGIVFSFMTIPRSRKTSMG